MFGWIKRWWRARQRAIDANILWPECIAAAKGNRVLAEKAFLTHANIDPAYRYMSAKEMQQFLENLP
jgi:hypothetical protein